MRVGLALLWAKNLLYSSAETPALDAELLLGHCLGLTRAQLISYTKRQLSSFETKAFKHYIQRRQAGEPVAYLLGRKEFWSLSLQVTQATLIPRPETELLVEQVLNHYSADSQLLLADLGTGSGAIALALGFERPSWKIIGTDLSQMALELAYANSCRLGIKNVQFRHGNWCLVLDENEYFHGIISNPPYIASSDPNLAFLIRYEPELALSGGESGLEAIKKIIIQAKKHLKPGGYLWLEHGHDQTEIVPTLLKEHFYIDVKQFYDLAGIVRVSMATWPG